MHWHVDIESWESEYIVLGDYGNYVRPVMMVNGEWASLDRLPIQSPKRWMRMYDLAKALQTIEEDVET